MPSQSAKIVAAFDLSLTGTGCAANPYGGIISRTLVPPAKMNGMPRLDWILKQIRSSVVTGYKEPSVNFVVFEDLAFAAHDRNHERAGLATLVRHMLWEEGIPYVLVAPTTLKKFVTGSGKADKSQMMLAVYKHWAITPANDNEADAIGLLQIGLALASPDSPSIPKYQQECLAVIRKNNPHI